MYGLFTSGVHVYVVHKKLGEPERGPEHPSPMSYNGKCQQIFDAQLLEFKNKKEGTNPIFSPSLTPRLCVCLPVFLRACLTVCLITYIFIHPVNHPSMSVCLIIH